MSEEIELNKGFKAIVDSDWYELLNSMNWYAKKGRNTEYAARECGRHTIRMHRFIMAVSDPKVFIDHINGNGLDNRRANLRLCSIQQNTWNSEKRKDNTSGHKGVYWNKKIKKWEASVRKDLKLQYLGSFDDKEEASRAYQSIAKELFGKFYKEVS